MQVAKRELEINCLEAEAIWDGEKVKEARQALASCVQRLWAAIVLDHEASISGGLMEPALVMERFRTIYPEADPGGGDAFMDALLRAIARVEEIARPRLA